MYFDVSAEAYIELQFVFNNRNKMIIELYDEIKKKLQRCNNFFFNEYSKK